MMNEEKKKGWTLTRKVSLKVSHNLDFFNALQKKEKKKKDYQKGIKSTNQRNFSLPNVQHL